MSEEFKFNEDDDLKTIASTMSVTQFSELTKRPIRLWGNPSTYSCVTIGRFDYLWKLKDGQFDGWNVSYSEPEQ